MRCMRLDGERAPQSKRLVHPWQEHSPGSAARCRAVCDPGTRRVGRVCDERKNGETAANFW
jgi:hypothetical protein